MLPEIRRLLTGLIQRYVPDRAHMLAWSNWRRNRQYQAQVCHYRRRGYVLISPGHGSEAGVKFPGMAEGRA